MTVLSVIIPVYNARNYISSCIESVLSQTLFDIEIILIDDNSTDGTDKILEKYVKKDSRIRLIKNNQNIGAGLSRNKGIKAALGKYVGFVDNDDWIDENYFEDMVNSIEEENADVCVTLKIKNHKNGFSKSHEISSKDLRRAVFIERTPPWAKIFKRDFLINNKIYFTKGRGEDIFPAFLTSYLAENITCSKNSFYHCTIREDSISHKKITLSDINEITVYQNIFEYIKGRTGKDFWLPLIYERGMISFDFLWTMANSATKKEIMAEYKRIFKKSPRPSYYLWKIGYKTRKIISFLRAKI